MAGYTPATTTTRHTNSTRTGTFTSKHPPTPAAEVVAEVAVAAVVVVFAATAVGADTARTPATRTAVGVSTKSRGIHRDRASLGDQAAPRTRGNRTPGPDGRRPD